MKAGRRGRPTRQRSAAERESIRRAAARQTAAALARKQRLHIGVQRPRSWVKVRHYYVTTLVFDDGAGGKVQVNEVTRSSTARTIASMRDQWEERVAELILKYGWTFDRILPEIRHFIPAR